MKNGQEVFVGGVGFCKSEKIFGAAVRPCVERVFLLDNCSNLLGIDTLWVMGCRCPKK